jgi:hypothetical protein
LLRIYSRCGHARPSQLQPGNVSKEPTMARMKQATRRHSRTKAAAATALGAAGLGLSLVGGASASTLPAADIPRSDNGWSEHSFVLNEEEMADVSLATFHLFDKESGTAGVQLAYRGCGGCRGCRGCRGCGVRACAGCGGGGGCCASWGRCRVC